MKRSWKDRHCEICGRIIRSGNFCSKCEPWGNKAGMARWLRMNLRLRIGKEKTYKNPPPIGTYITTIKCTPPPDWVVTLYDEQKQFYYKRKKEAEK